MHKKYILIILAVALCTHAVVLLNGFVGDDEIVIVNNTFYKSWKNIPRLFKKDYITRDSDIFINVEGDKRSGSVAYRPVLSITYFIDYWIWKLNPFGYHLTNLLLHIFNCFLVYFLALFIIQNKNVSLLGALLFCVHPVQSEAVSSIGYRADCLSSFFILSSFLSFVKYREDTKRNAFLLIASLLFFGLGLFVKESAIVLPVLIIAYDWYFYKKEISMSLHKLMVRYGGYFIITACYLYIYFFVFRNSAINTKMLIGGTLITHIIAMSQIFLGYIMNLTLPSTVQILPPQYAPPMDHLWMSKLLLAVSLLFLIFYLIYKTYRHLKPVSFFLFWFLAALIPVSNIFPLPNPMAHRFLYLPSVGFLIMMAILIDKVCSNPDHFKTFPNLGRILRVCIIAVCIMMTMPLNRLWKSNYSVARELIEHYPNDAQGYLIMGLDLFRLGLYDHTKMVVNRSLALGLRDPRAYYVLGVCYSREPQIAKKHFQNSIRLFPHFSLSYTGMGRVLIFEGEYKRAILYFNKSLEIEPTYTGYGYLMQSYLFLDRPEELLRIYEEAKKTITDENRLRSLHKFITLEKPLEEPIDIGI